MWYNQIVNMKAGEIMTLQQKLKRSNFIMFVSFLIYLSIFTLFFIDEEHLVSSITLKDSIGVLIASVSILFVIIFGLFYLPMLFVIKFTFRLPILSISNPKTYVKYIFRNININRTPKHLQLCVFRC